MGNRLSLPQKLHKAVKDNNVHSVQDVCKKAATAGPAVLAATLEHKDDKGRTPLLLACGRGYAQVAKLLLQHGANLKHMRRCGNGGSALHEAAASGSDAVAKLLLDKGADPFQENYAGKMALEVASAMKHTSLVRQLEVHGLMKGFVELKVPSLAGISTTWQIRWICIFSRHPNPSEAQLGERLEAWLYTGTDSPQPKCRVVLEGCHVVVAGQELKLTLRSDHVEPENAYCPRCPGGSYVVSLRAAPHYDGHFKLLVRCLSAHPQAQVAHYNGLSDTELPAMQGAFANGPTAENTADAGGLVNPAPARRVGAAAGGAVIQEPSAPMLDATPTTPRATAPIALSRSPGPKPPGAPSRRDAEAPDSAPASDSWGTLGPLHTYRPSRNTSQPPSPSSHYYQPTEPLTPTSSNPPSPSGAYFASPTSSRRASDTSHAVLPAAAHITPPSLPFCHVSPTSSSGSPAGIAAPPPDPRTHSPTFGSNPNSPGNHYYWNERSRLLLHSDNAVVPSNPQHSARFASQPPSPSSGYYPQTLFSSPPAPEPSHVPPQMPSSARYHRANTRDAQPPSPPPNYIPQSRSVSDMQVLAQQGAAPPQGHPGHSHRSSTGSIDATGLMPLPSSPGPNYYVTSSAPSITTVMEALPGETDEQFARRLATAMWQSTNRQATSPAANRSSPPPFAPATASPSAPPTARAHLAPAANPRSATPEPPPAPPSTARHAWQDGAQQHSPTPSAPPAFSSSRGGSPFDDLSTCVICMSRPREAGFLHGETVHNCACRECAKLIPNGSACPICRQAIERVLGIY